MMKTQEKQRRGLVLVLLGVGLLLWEWGLIAELGRVVRVGLVKLWPVLLIWFGVKVVRRRVGRGVGLFLVGLGVIFLLVTVLKLDFLGVLIPSLLIFLGWRLMVGRGR